MPSNVRHRRNISSNDHMSEIKEQAVSIGESVRAMAATAGAAAGESLTPIETYVREKPIKSLLMAAGAGALLSLFFFRR